MIVVKLRLYGPFLDKTLQLSTSCSIYSLFCIFLKCLLNFSQYIVLFIDYESCDSVEDWLYSLNLSQYIDVFHLNNLTSMQRVQHVWYLHLNKVRSNLEITNLSSTFLFNWKSRFWLNPANRHWYRDWELLPFLTETEATMILTLVRIRLGIYIVVDIRFNKCDLIKRNFKHECIPVGFVPPAHWPYPIVSDFLGGSSQPPPRCRLPPPDAKYPLDADSPLDTLTS